MSQVSGPRFFKRFLVGGIILFLFAVFSFFLFLESPESRAREWQGDPIRMSNGEFASPGAQYTETTLRNGEVIRREVKSVPYANGNSHSPEEEEGMAIGYLFFSVLLLLLAYLSRRRWKRDKQRRGETGT